MSKKKVALIGFGYWGQKIYRYLKESEDFDIQYVFFRSLKNLSGDNIKKKYGSEFVSTIDSILSLQTFIDNANHTGRKLVILNWDVSQAFDRCSRLMVQEVLRILGFGDVLISYIANLPIGALARVCINLAESRFPNLFASNGCAQGQSSSAQKFCLAMYVILLRLDMQDISSFKIELGVKRKMSLLESYTNYLW